MAKRTDIKKILIIGSGPIVIGQAAEFDYAGTQACLALKEEGYEVILCNSNPATIMTDEIIADKIYMEPLTPEYMADILRAERPDAMLPGFGGQIGLNLAMQLEQSGVLREYGIELLGTSIETIRRAEDRELFKRMCQTIGEPTVRSEIAYSVEEAKKAAYEIGYPVVLRPAFTLGGTGSGFANCEEELVEIASNGFLLSPLHQVLVEKSVKGYKEIEFELMRDAIDHVIIVCGMENVEPVGVHTGDSIVAAPILSLHDGELKMLRDSAVKIIRELKIHGGCNIQFAFDPESSRYYLIEVNTRVSRSSTLASKASAYPIARVAAKIAVGMTLEEISIADTNASVEPTLDYVAVKLPCFPFDKFPSLPNTLGTQMKATGEVMGIGSAFEEAMLKAVRSLERGMCHLYLAKFDEYSSDDLLAYISAYRDDTVFAIAQLIRRGITTEKLHQVTHIADCFLQAIGRIVSMEQKLISYVRNTAVMREAKRMGFSDEYIAKLWGMDEKDVYAMRMREAILPAYRMVDARHTGGKIPYYYSSYSGRNASLPSKKKKIIVLGSGPIRIGQGIEFDYSTVHAVKSIKAAGFEAIIINNNPETVSTDYETADKLYFEPLTVEDVINIVAYEKPEGVIASLGGQTAINLAKPLELRGAKIIGTDCTAIEKSENRDSFHKMLLSLEIPQPKGKVVYSVDDGASAAGEIGYPLLVRPSFVLGGRAMQIVGNERQLRQILKAAFELNTDQPVLVDQYIPGKEIEVDAVSDGYDVFIPGIMELVERAGIHSGDSISVYPPFSLSNQVKRDVLAYTKRLGLGLGIIGLYNIQFVVDSCENVYVIEVNPRSSRTVPFLSKATGYNLADIAAEVMLGKTLRQLGIPAIQAETKKKWYVKVPVFPFGKLIGADVFLSPEMKSTGEVIGSGNTLNGALRKAFVASGMKLSRSGTVLVSVADGDKEEALPLIRRFINLGFRVEETDRQGRIAYVIMTREIGSAGQRNDENQLGRYATQNNIPLFTSLDTVRALLDVLEETSSLK